jgi:fibro-slime domain-containing protein
VLRALTLGWLVVLLLASCGRTGLLTADPCGDEGATMACANDCGDGVVTCRGGFWSACEVPETARACENTCGSGSQTCRDGAWSSCEVAPVERSCSGLCGQGVETCTQGAWGGCEMPPVDLPCKSTCGDGVQHCENERLGYCATPLRTRACASACGAGHEACVDGAWQPCDAPQPRPPLLHAVIRDFQPATNPDFEFDLHGGDGNDPYIVDTVLGHDDTPIYTNDPRIHTTSGPTFYEWYHDTPDSIRIEYDIQLQNSPTRPGFFLYDNPAFFPLDDRGFGNDGYAHNFHFTLATMLTFHYVGGEVFDFSGDDDIWVFVNRHLAINLGGLHQRESASVSLDAHAAEFELSPGTTYAIHIFFAERHSVDSEFRVETSVADQGSCP